MLRVDVDDAGRQAFAASEGLLAYRAVSPDRWIRRLTWVNRDGTNPVPVWTPGEFGAIALAPDGRRAAISRYDGSQADIPDIWVVDLERGAAERLTNGRWAEYPIWSRDGDRVIFSVARGLAVKDLYSKRVDGSGEPEILLDSPAVWKSPLGWSADGWLVFAAAGPRGRIDLWAAPAGDRRPAVLLMQGAPDAQLVDAAISTDGQFIAYSAPSGIGRELYVQPLRGGPRVQVSASGGADPRWRADGSELYFVSNGKLMAAEVSRRGDTLAVGTTVPLFDYSARNDYVPSSDGKRFLLAAPVAGQEGPTQPTVILNWQTIISHAP